MMSMSLTFLSPLMLTGLVALVLPVAVHLFSRRTRIVLTFPTIRMLEDSLRGQTRLLRIRRWVLLVLRCLALAFLAAAFARPVWSSPPDLMAWRQGVTLLVVLDNSASSAQRVEGVAVLETLRVNAARLAGQLRPGIDSINVIVTAPVPHLLLPHASAQPTSAINAIHEVKSSDARGDLVAALGLAAQQAEQAPGTPRLVVLSDLQATQWAEVSRQNVAGINMPVSVIDPSLAEMSNLAITSTGIYPARPHPGQRVQLSCTITNYSAESRLAAVGVTLDGSSLGRREVEVMPWSSSAVQFDAPALEDREHLVRFSVDDPIFAVDNAAYRVIQPRTQPRVLLVTDEALVSPQSVYFISRALAPSNEIGAKVTTSRPSELTLSAMNQADVVLVAGVRNVSAAAARLLAGQVVNGGGLLVFADDRNSITALQAINEALPTERKPALFDSEIRTRSEPWRIISDSMEPHTNPMSRMLAAALTTARFTATFPLPKSLGDVILSFDDDTPAVLTKAAGRGRLVVCNFGVDPRVSNLAQHGSLVVLLHELCDYLAPADDALREVMVGERLEFTRKWVNVAAAGRMTIVSPDGSTNPVQSQIVAVPRTDTVGFYRLKRGDETLAWAAANIDPRESDLRRIKPDAAQALFDGSTKLNRTTASIPSIKPQVDELWPQFVIAAIVMLSLEMIIVAFWKS